MTRLGENEWRVETEFSTIPQHVGTWALSEGTTYILGVGCAPCPTVVPHTEEVRLPWQFVAPWGRGVLLPR